MNKSIGIKSLFNKKHHPHDAGFPLLAVENLTVNYPGGPAIEDISFNLEHGKRIALIGPNGAGKSTLFKAITGIIKPSAGKVNIYGSAPGRHHCISYVEQRSHVDWGFPASVADVVMMSRVSRIGFFRRPAASDWEIVFDALEVVNMAGLAKKQIGELSGGQQQRVFIARALAQEAELMLLDEPMNGLDSRSQDDIFKILDLIDEQQVTALVSLHDMKMARERFEQVMLINRKLLGFGSPAQVFSSEALVEAYSSHLHFVRQDDGRLAVSDMCCNDEEEND